MRTGTAQRFRAVTGTSMRTRLPTAVIVVSLISLVVATIVGVRTGTSLGRDLTDERLVALRASAASDVDADLGSLRRSAQALASSDQAVVRARAVRRRPRELEAYVRRRAPQRARGARHRLPAAVSGSAGGWADERVTCARSSRSTLLRCTSSTPTPSTW